MGAIVGREQELSRISSLLDLRPEEPRVLVLEGEPGMGKTTLWRAGVEEARTRGFHVLACTAAESETQLAFTALRDLLGARFASVADALPEPQRRALAVTLLLEGPGELPPEPGTIGTAFLSALRAAAAPLVVAVDDVQWVDAASAAALSFAARRLGAEPVVFLFAGRPGPGAVSPPPAAETVQVGPVTVGALGRILHDALGVPSPRPTLQRLHEAAGGNPFFALELARSLGDSARLLRPGDVIPVPGSLRDLVRGRIETLPPETLDALAILAAGGRPEPADAYAPAAAAGLVEAAGGTIRFAHPLFASAAYGAASPARRREIHAQLADEAGDVEERARHLALGADGPDEAVAALVEEGARTAFGRGSPAEAAALARRARSLTPPDRPADAARRALDEADFAFAAGDTTGAALLLDELADGAPPGRHRARILGRQARLRHFASDVAGSVELLRAALPEAGDGALRVEIEEGLAWGLLLSRRELDRANDHARSAARLARRLSDEAALAEALAAEALTAFVLGRASDEAMEEALALEEAVLGLRVLRHPTFALGYRLGCADELDAARDAFLELVRRAERSGDEGSMPSLLNHLALVELLAGRWGESERHADEGFARAQESGQHPTQVSIRAKSALLDARRGELAAATAAARQSLEIAGFADFDAADPAGAMARGAETAIWTLGFVELSAGRPEQAYRLLGPMTSTLLEVGVREPGELRALPDAVEALVQLGRVDEAEALLRPFAEAAERLDRPSAQAAAARLRGLILEARGEGAAALASLDRAAALADRLAMPFEAGRAQLAFGAAQRRARQRRAARETLARAVELFEGIGASTWADLARSELGRIGGRAPSGDELTPSERRIAELVAEGRTNGEVAAALVVSVHTVEAALTSVYRKLDVRSRTEMARKLSGDGAGKV